MFYDYDELCPLTRCNFRKLPQASRYEDELSSEPWFYVADNDVFPEEFRKLLELSGLLRGVFVEHHGDIFEIEFRCSAQEAITPGKLPHIDPYESNVQSKI